MDIHGLLIEIYVPVEENIHGYPLISMDILGYPWTSIEQSLDIHGWSRDLHGRAMDINGSPWISIDNI